MDDKNLSRTLRLTKLQNFLALKTASGGATLQQITEHCNVTERQVYRDLKDLEQKLDIKILRPRRGQKNDGKYKMNENLPLKIGPETAATIFLSILRQKGSPLAPQINEVKDLLIAALFKNRYGSHIEEIEKLQNRVHIVEEQLLDDVKSGTVLLKLMDAIKDNRVVNIKYFKPHGALYSKRDVEPYGLTSKHNNWYLVGFCRSSQGERTFRIDLIEDVHVLTQKFDYPENFCLKNYFGNSWGIYAGDDTKRIVIRVGPELAYRFKLISYHPSQKIQEELEDGSLVVSYNACGMFELTGWLLQWGELIEVLEPKDLRQVLRERLEKILSKYI